MKNKQLKYNIVATGSTGNAVIYHKTIVVDCGISFKNIKPYINDLSLILLTHSHLDHINIKTLQRLQFERPALRIGCCEWMSPLLIGLKNIDIYEIGQIYDYVAFKISPIKLYHNVKNCGYRIFKDDYKILHCTDTSHLEGITAKNYDLFAIEHNYNEDTIFESIDNNIDAGIFDYRSNSVNNHLSEQQAREFIYKNANEESEILRLHESLTI